MNLCTHKFKISIDPELFSNNVYMTSKLEEIVRSVDLIVSPRDVFELRRRGAKIEIMEMKKEDLKAIEKFKK